MVLLGSQLLVKVPGARNCCTCHPGSLGEGVGLAEGAVGAAEGPSVGASVGAPLGAEVGVAWGRGVGADVGPLLGLREEGEPVGLGSTVQLSYGWT